MSQSQCRFKKPINDENFTSRQQVILRSYGYQNEYQCPLSKEGKSKYCRYHSRETIEKQVEEEKELTHSDLPQFEAQKNDQDGKPLSPYLFVGCYFPRLSFPQNDKENRLDSLYFLNCEILGDFNAEDTHFDGVSAIGSQFQVTRFLRAQFHQIADFSRAQFKEAHFSQAQFHQRSDFGWATFHLTATFSKAQFQTTFFRDAQFKTVDFSWARFQVAFFHNTQFQTADFSNAQFKESHFTQAQFQSVFFHDVQFHQRADFRRTQFQTADFSWAQFQTADFTNAQFHQRADFKMAQFYQTATFTNAQFQTADFSNAQFKEVHFLQAKFYLTTDFSWTQFHQVALFHHTKFNGEVRFTDTRFTGIAVFNHVPFSSTVTFENTKFIINHGQHLDELGKNQVICFHHCKFLQPLLVTFDDVNFTYVSFVGTDVSRIRLGSVTWSGQKEWNIVLSDELLYREQNLNPETNETITNSYFDDEGLYASVKKYLPARIEEVWRVYRRFRESFEYATAYGQAGQFFYRELELKRWAARTRRNELRWTRRRAATEWLMLTVYKLTSSYGESVAQALVWFLFAIPAFAFLTTLYHAFALGASLTLSLFERQFAHSMGLFFQVREVSPETFYLDVFERIVSIFLFGNLFIATRRQYERKIRG